MNHKTIKIRQTNKSLLIKSNGRLTGKWIIGYLSRNGFELDGPAIMMLKAIDLHVVVGVRSQFLFFISNGFGYTVKVIHDDNARIVSTELIVAK